MKIATVVTCLLIVFGWTGELLAQFVPVIAKQRSVHYLKVSDGTEMEVIRKEGTYFRSSSGSVLDTMLQVAGQDRGKHGAIHMDSSTRKTYALNHNVQTATLKQVRTGPFRPVVLRPDLAIEKGVIEGLDCIAMRVVSPRDRKKAIGKVWWAKDAKLVVKKETILGLERIVRELYDIRFSEPKPSVFRFPTHYKIDDSEWKKWRRYELGAIRK